MHLLVYVNKRILDGHNIMGMSSNLECNLCSDVQYLLFTQTEYVLTDGDQQKILYLGSMQFDGKFLSGAEWVEVE